ncbi:putative serine/threonine-protein kinase nek3 [Diplonema papillatum]|nr:putative serine/threonine-protein kinase nek3 [Diplonema papillatum]
MQRSAGNARSSSPAGNARTLPPEMGRYEAIDVIGQGSFGAAILVRRQKELFVAKEMNICDMSAPDRESVFMEVKILAALQHPNIIRYEECVQTGAVLYIIMEFADGGDLYHKICSLEEPMSEDVVLYIFAQICLAVKHLHARRILHRDLKTQNVFLTKDNIVKLGDFGLATALRHTWQARSLCGTPNYFSPELVAGRPYNNKADIWAMGCILYELVTRRFAFTGSTMSDIMQRIATEQPAPIPPNYSDGLRMVLSRMLCKEQAIRPSIEALTRANILKSALQHIQSLLQEGQPVKLPSPAPTNAHAVVTQSPLPNTPPLNISNVPARSPVSDPCRSPPVNFREEDLTELENEILKDHLNLGRRSSAVDGALLQEISHVLCDEDSDDKDQGEEFGDDVGVQWKGASSPELKRSTSLEGEIEGLIAEFQQLDDVIRR